MEDGAVGVVVPVWNRRDLIAPLLATLRAQTALIGEIVVVDNGSTDGAGEAAAAGGARVLRLERNLGFAPAVNRGIAAVRTSWVAVLNNDVELAPDYLERLRAAAEQSGAWLATGRILSGGSEILDGTFDLVSRGATAWRAGHGQPDSPEFAQPRTIFAAPWTAVLLRAELFARVGLLEESFESYLEDVDFGVRCAAAGLSGIYVPEAVARHAGSATLGELHPETVRRIARNQVFLFARHFPARWWWHAVVAQALWGGVAWRHGRLLAWLRGKAEGLRAYRKVRSTYSPKTGVALGPWLDECELLLRREPSTYWRLYARLTK